MSSVPAKYGSDIPIVISPDWEQKEKVKRKIRSLRFFTN
tara:strand:+ start:541 stop:657 length:117 start_codon:yes stop_codon:yes gene_type:complete